MADKNVLVRVPKVGDILCVDADHKKQFIALDTYDGGTLPAGYTVVGVVASRQGNQALVVHKTNAAKKWADIYHWKVTGWTLDGASHTTNITFYSSQQAASNPAFTYAATNYGTVASLLNDWFDVYFSESNLRYHAIALADGVQVQVEPYASWYQYIINFSGLTVASLTDSFLKANGGSYRKSGRSIYWGAINVRRYGEWAKSEGSVPTTDVPVHISANTHAVKLVEFQQNAYCADIRNAYCADPSNPTEEDYFRYVEAEYACEYPSNRASMAEMYRDGKKNTYSLAGRKYTAYDGTEKGIYPAADYCAEVEYDVDGLRKGDWFLPSKYQMGGIWSMLTYGHAGVSRASADPINRSLNAIGGSAISCTSLAWSSAMGSSYYAWNYSSLGYFSYGYFCISLMCVPCVLLNLSEGEE